MGNNSQYIVVGLFIGMAIGYGLSVIMSGFWRKVFKRTAEILREEYGKRKVDGKKDCKMQEL